MQDDNKLNRLSEHKTSSPTTIQFSVTNACNLNCSFCGGVSYMKTCSGETVPDAEADTQFNVLVDTLQNNPSITDVNWMGGEPLLAYRNLKEWIARIKVQFPNVSHQLSTNFTRVRMDMVPTLKMFDVVTISLDGYKESERPLWFFVASEKYEAFEVLAELNNWNVVSVITRDRLENPRWYEDLFLLHNALHHLNPRAFTMVLDSNMSKPLGADHCLNLIYGISEMERNMERLNRGVTSPVRVILNRFFDSVNCNVCSETIIIGGDGAITQATNAERVVDSGCNLTAKFVGPDAYKFLQKFINERGVV